MENKSHPNVEHPSIACLQSSVYFISQIKVFLKVFKISSKRTKSLSYLAVMMLYKFNFFMRFSHHYQVLRNDIFKKDLKTQFFLGYFFLKLHHVTSLLNFFFSSQFDLFHSLHSSEFSCQKIQRGQNYHLEKSLFFFYETCLRLFKYTIRISGMNFLSLF